MPQDPPKEDLRRYLPSRRIADRLARGEVWKTPATGIAPAGSDRPAEAEHPAVTVPGPAGRRTRGAVWISVVAVACVALTAAVAFWAGQKGTVKDELRASIPSVSTGPASPVPGTSAGTPSLPAASPLPESSAPPPPNDVPSANPAARAKLPRSEPASPSSLPPPAPSAIPTSSAAAGPASPATATKPQPFDPLMNE